MEAKDCQLKFTFDTAGTDKKAARKKQQWQTTLDKMRWGAVAGKMPPKHLLPPSFAEEQENGQPLNSAD